MAQYRGKISDLSRPKILRERTIDLTWKQYDKNLFICSHTSKNRYLVESKRNVHYTQVCNITKTLTIKYKYNSYWLNLVEDNALITWYNIAYAYFIIEAII